VLTIRKATLDDLEFLISADLSGDGYTESSAELTAVELHAHRIKIAAFVQDETNRGAWVCEDTETNKTVGMILCRFRKYPPNDADKYPGDDIFVQLGDSVFSDNCKFCEVFQLWVDERYRRRGIATRLKQRLEIESKRREIGIIYTHTEEKNLHVLELNRRLGYKEVRRGPIWDDTPRVSLVKYL
jgi:ribosomal protein S18 acetylase RimI-like enzyme